jgi:predicted MFS family arabinose efflux permease
MTDTSRISTLDDVPQVSQYRTVTVKRQLPRVFLPFALGFFLSYLYRAVNSVIAADLVADLGIDPAQLELLTSTYFLAFVATQIPLGVALDRFEPRRVEAVLLMIAAAGALLFARAESLGGLILGRALIGLGVSACLMAPFTAYARWVPAERLSTINGLQLAAGGFGALTATYPVQLGLRVVGWRGVFLVLSGFTLAVAALIRFVVPPTDGVSSNRSLRIQLREMRGIYGSAAFQRVAPWAALSQASFLAVQGLWAGPWLLEVGGYTREAAAFVLMLLAMAMIVGYASAGAIAERLGRRGVSPTVVMAAGMLAFTATLVALRLVPPGGLTPMIWVLFGFFGTSGTLAYSVLSRTVPRDAAGRVNTAHNLLVFIAAFGTQWGVGTVIKYGGAGSGGYDRALTLIIALTVAGATWFAVAPTRENR